MPNFSFLMCPHKIAIWRRKTKPTKPSQNSNQPNRQKPFESSYLCNLRLRAKCLLPRLCLSFISMVEEKKGEGKNAVLEAIPSPAEIELS